MPARFLGCLALPLGGLVLPVSAGPAGAQTLLGAARRRIPDTRHIPPAPRRTPAPRVDAPPSARTPSLEAVAWQAALDRAGFSPGLIDGLIGPKTRTALGDFQAAAGLPATGRLDGATRAALALDALPATRVYVLTEDDAAQVGRCPVDWIEKSREDWLGFESLAAVAANRGHCTRRLLERLNPDVNLDALSVGDALHVPDVVPRRPETLATEVEIDFGTRTLRLFDAAGRQLGLLHCSIARERRQRPAGPCTVASISYYPEYLFKPESWPEIRGIERRLVIPPGPRNPVGVCWIGLSIRGYGIHGSPRPELIGKTGSHGCFRLTNWDILRLSRRVRIGTPVRFVDTEAARVAGGSQFVRKPG